MSSPHYDIDRWWMREWQKVVPEQGMYRFYRLTLQQNLWGEWELHRSWGRVGRQPSRTVLLVLPDPAAAEVILQDVERARRKRGYLPLS